MKKPKPRPECAALSREIDKAEAKIARLKEVLRRIAGVDHECEGLSIGVDWCGACIAERALKEGER
mgnify:CR=1 FL=1